MHSHLDECKASIEQSSSEVDHLLVETMHFVPSQTFPHILPVLMEAQMLIYYLIHFPTNDHFWHHRRYAWQTVSQPSHECFHPLVLRSHCKVHYFLLVFPDYSWSLLCWQETSTTSFVLTLWAMLAFSSRSLRSERRQSLPVLTRWLKTSYIVMELVTSTAVRFNDTGAPGSVTCSI